MREAGSFFFRGLQRNKPFLKRFLQFEGFKVLGSCLKRVLQGKVQGSRVLERDVRVSVLRIEGLRGQVFRGVGLMSFGWVYIALTEDLLQSVWDGWAEDGKTE